MGWTDWIRTVEVEPSLYAADFARLGAQVDALLRTGTRIFHFDVGDGHFVEPVTMGPVVLRSIADEVHRAGGVLDVHLMVEQPERHIPQFAAAGADSVTVHHEVATDADGLVALARKHELQIGLAVNPATRVEEAATKATAAGVDLVLCMSVVPGYSGQEFLDGSLERLRWLRDALPDQIHLQVDGGITEENIRPAHEAGANLIVAASAIFAHDDPSRAYRQLVQALA